MNMIDFGNQSGRLRIVLYKDDSSSIAYYTDEYIYSWDIRRQRLVYFTIGGRIESELWNESLFSSDSSLRRMASEAIRILEEYVRLREEPLEY